MLGQVGRAGRFDTMGLAITFVSDEADTRTLNDMQNRFEVNITDLPGEIEVSSYSKFCSLQLVIDYNRFFVVFTVEQDAF